MRNADVRGAGVRFALPPTPCCMTIMNLFCHRFQANKIPNFEKICSYMGYMCASRILGDLSKTY